MVHGHTQSTRIISELPGNLQMKKMKIDILALQL